MADWLPTWLARERGYDLAGMDPTAWHTLRVTDAARFDAHVKTALDSVGLIVGGVTVVGGLGGTLIGGWLGDRMAKWTRHPYLALSALTMIPAALLAAGALHATNLTLTLVLVGAAQLLMWCYNSPINALIANSTDAALRVRAFSLSILCIHLFGDAISPTIIGALSDATGSLTLALDVVPATLLLGGLVWLVGWRRLP
jgi:fucose permease